jgi:hypothetical protein
MVRKAMNLSGADVKLFNIVELCEPCANRLEIAGLVAEHMPEVWWTKYRSSIDIAGNSNACGAFRRYRSGSLILRVADDWRLLYWDLLKPWVHYVPVKGDFSDLAERVNFVNSNRPEDIASLKEMTLAAERVLENATYDSKVLRVAQALTRVWRAATAAAAAWTRRALVSRPTYAQQSVLSQNSN